MTNAAMRAMRMALALAAFLFSALCSTLSLADIPATANCSTGAANCVQWSGGGVNGPWFSTQAVACENWRAQFGSAAPTVLVFQNPYVCSARKPDGSLHARYDQHTRQINAGYTCPANSTASTPGQCSCNAGYVQNGNTCEVNQCASNAGQVKVINNTVAWFRSTAYDDWRHVGAAVDPPSELCEGGCKWRSGQDVKAWRSLEPSAQGLYRYSIDTQYVSQAEACSTAVGASNNPQAPNATCPGYVGEINGKTACVGTAQQPIPSPTGATPSTNAQPGNPAAGKAPDTGPGSGTAGNPRTPASGVGGNSGGPSSSAVVTGAGQVGAGTVSAPGEGKEQAACGAPGQPKCGIDETGTPDASSIGNGIDGLNQADGQRTGILEGIKTTADKDGSWGVLPRWLSRGECAPFDFGTWPVINVELSLNLCPYRGMYDAIASFILVILTFATITVMVRETIVGN